MRATTLTLRFLVGCHGSGRPTSTSGPTSTSESPRAHKYIREPQGPQVHQRAPGPTSISESLAQCLTKWKALDSMLHLETCCRQNTHLEVVSDLTPEEGSCLRQFHWCCKGDRFTASKSTTQSASCANIGLSWKWLSLNGHPTSETFGSLQ
jgi:hypothetical protein